MSNEPTSWDRAQPHHRYFVVTSGVFLAIVLVGFAPSFFLSSFFQAPGAVSGAAELLRGSGGGSLPAGAPGLPLLVVAHGALLSAWFAVLFVQTLLVASNRRDLHRKLGVAGMLLAVAVVIASTAANVGAIPRVVALAGLPDASAALADNLPLICGNFGTLFVFTLAVGGAAYFRHKPEIHKHCILLASIIVVTPAIDRFWLWTGVEYAMEIWLPLTGTVFLVTVVGGLWLTRRRPPRLLIAGLVAWFVLQGVLSGIGTTETARSWALALMSP